MPDTKEVRLIDGPEEGRTLTVKYGRFLQFPRHDGENLWYEIRGEYAVFVGTEKPEPSE